MSIESRSKRYGTVFGHWQILGHLGGGSGGKSAVFGLVYNSASSHYESALKVISLIEESGDLQALSQKDQADYQDVLKKLRAKAEREVQLMNTLRGKTNIVDYHDHTFVDWSEDDHYGCDMLIRMEKLTDLRKEMRGGKQFSEAEIVKIGIDICQALRLCHRKGIYHRDIKPENIFISEDRDYKLGDFGIARILSAAPTTANSTNALTPQYAAPEQFRGDYDQRTDIYSLGLVLYELCNRNRLPFVQSRYVSDDAIRRRLSGAAFPLLSGIRDDLAKVILKACSFSPKDRYQTAKDFQDALRAIRFADEPPAPPSMPPSRMKRIAAAAAVGAAMLTVLLLGHFSRSGEPVSTGVVPQTDTSVQVTASKANTPTSDIVASGFGDASPGPVLSDLEPGQIIELGHYEQDGNTANGAESIEWLVLTRDEDTALVVSVFGLDSVPYEDRADTADWESCSARAWLEEAFYEDAFSEEEKLLITEAAVDQHRNEGYPACDQGADTIDHVFLLSAKEYLDHLYNNDAIDAQYREGVPSEYALEQGLDVTDYYLGERCWWWLRTSSVYNKEACFVNAMGPGEVYTGYDINRQGGLIRPAMWVRLSGTDQTGQTGVRHTDGSGVLMTGYTKTMGAGPEPATTVFGSDISREQIKAMRFLDTLADAPAEAWDVSQAQNGSVLAWVVPVGGDEQYRQYELYIAGEGGVWAPADCTYLFAGYQWLETLDFNNCFFLENCESMRGMFFRNGSLERLELPNWDTSTVTDMSELFCYCSSLRELDVDTLDTGAVTDMSSMFARCEALTALDLSGFDTSRVTDMSSMFFQSWYLSDLDLSGFDTGRVTNIDYMFYCCALEDLDLSSFDTSRVISSVLLWQDSPALKTLTVGARFDLSILRELAGSLTALMAEGGTINGQPWETFLS